ERTTPGRTFLLPETAISPITQGRGTGAAGAAKTGALETETAGAVDAATAPVEEETAVALEISRAEALAGKRNEARRRALIRNRFPLGDYIKSRRGPPRGPGGTIRKGPPFRGGLSLESAGP